MCRRAINSTDMYKNSEQCLVTSFNILIFNVYEYFACMCNMCPTYIPPTPDIRRGPQALCYSIGKLLWAVRWTLGTKSRSCARTISALTTEEYLWPKVSKVIIRDYSILYKIILLCLWCNFFAFCNKEYLIFYNISH